MLSKIKKIKLYFQALYKGELLKRIEYRMKDFFGYFYIRNKFQYKKQNCNIYDIDINIANVDCDFIKEGQYKIFNKKYDYQEIIKNFNVEEKFWRKIKLNQYEDIKLIWEYNRLQILLPLVIKYLNTQNNEYKKQIEEILDCWKKNNRFEYTLNWNSNLEVAIRAINISLTLLLLKDEELNNKYSSLLLLHAKHIYSEINYSDACIPNNHVIGEATALLLLSRVLNTKKNNKWYKKSIKILTKYIDIIDNDGVSKENSFSYQFFVTKMYILALCFIKEKSLFEKLNDKIIKSLHVLKYTMISKESILNYGDNDDGFLYSIYMDYNIARDIEEYYNLFFKNEIKNETKIYMEIFKKFNSTNSITIGRENDKHYLLTKNIFIYKDNNIILFFNSKKIEGHAHNDSLSINLIINGQEVLLDSGTYSYNKSKNDRSYYRGRKAHSTIQLEQENAIQVGSFRWINEAKSYISHFEENENDIEIEGIIEDVATRKIIINKNEIKIIDNYLKKNNILTTWITNNNTYLDNNKIVIDDIEIIFDGEPSIDKQDIFISKKYFEKINATLYDVEPNNDNMLKTKIIFKEKNSK